MTASPLRLASDIGGTFTDIVLERGEARWSTKVLTTPQAPEQAVIDGSAQVLARAGFGFADLDVIIHGTTLATNAIIERKGAKTALIATEGFRDVIEIADESRYDQYDVFIDKPRALVPRRLRFTVPERVDVTGKVWVDLDDEAVAEVGRRLAGDGIEAVAIAFIHAYANSAHEERAREILARVAPAIAVTLSSEVCPEMREYERTSTAIANAYVQPLMAGYLARLKAGFEARGADRPIHLMTSGGFLASLETAARFPIRLVESGPAGGAILAAHIAAERDERKVVSFDMGGTTAKLCLIEGFQPHKARTFEVDRQSRFMKGSGLPVRIPVIEMVEIGAGGGSIARVDGLRRILVGPHSAGSVPGPACYGRGGRSATVTDADLVLGKINRERFAGGSISLDAGAAEVAVAQAVGTPLGLGAIEAAQGIAEIVDENMANAARVHGVERGIDVTDHTLVAFGGAAPLHAARLATKLGITRVVVPADAGVGSAVGFLRAPAAYELVRSLFVRLDRFDTERVNALIAAMSREARTLAKAAAGGRRLSETRTAFMRYAGQGHEIAIDLPRRTLRDSDVVLIRVRFERAYKQLFSRIIPGAAIEILSWSVQASTPVSAPPRLGVPVTCTGPKPIGRQMLTLGANPQSVPLIARDDLKPGMRVDGPVIVVEEGTSTLVTEDFDLTVDEGLALVLLARQGART